MMMSQHENTFRITGLLWEGGSTSFLDISENKLLNKQSVHWWFETPWHSYDVTAVWITVDAPYSSV